jgi:ABC-2 type transport system permease protein
MLYRYLIAEMIKLRRSLALFLCLAAPSCVVGLATLMWLRAGRPAQIGEFAVAVASLWGFAMLPLAVTALSVLLAQLEHGPRSWLHLLTLPGARPHVYLAKAIVIMGLIATMSGLLWIETHFGALFIKALRSNVTGEFYGVGLAALLSHMTAAATLAAMVQLWVALRFRSFVPPLVLGIAGTFVAFAAASADEGVYFPWLMPAKILSAPETQHVALTLGSLGGVAALLVMLIDLGRREV